MERPTPQMRRVRRAARRAFRGRHVQVTFESDTVVITVVGRENTYPSVTHHKLRVLSRLLGTRRIDLGGKRGARWGSSRTGCWMDAQIDVVVRL